MASADMTVPVTLASSDNNDFAVQVDASVRDDESGALWVHKDLVAVITPWAHEQHIGPVKADEAFGDVESWAAYVKRYGESEDNEESAFVTWNGVGLRAVLDYHNLPAVGRAQWIATCPFVRSPEWQAWISLCNGRPHGQREAIEALEDRAAEIIEPDAATLMALLRNLRATVNAKADTELAPDGSTSVRYSQDKSLRGAGDVTLPPEFAISVPVLKGHVDDDGKLVVYRLIVRLRASVDNDAHLALRFSIPNAERTLEAVYADRVAKAHELLGDGFAVLRAAG